MTLQLTGGRTVRADRATVWAALHDAACLKLCVPGCSSLERMSETLFECRVRVPLGPVSVAFSGTLAIVGRDVPRMLRLMGRGHGGLAGLAVGHACITLTECPVGCRLTYVVEAEPAGPFAAAGTPLLRGVAADLVDRFASTFATIVGDRPPLGRTTDAFRPLSPAS